MGWKHWDTVKELEGKRKVKAEAYWAKKKDLIKVCPLSRCTCCLWACLRPCAHVRACSWMNKCVSSSMLLPLDCQAITQLYSYTHLDTHANAHKRAHAVVRVLVWRT